MAIDLLKPTGTTTGRGLNYAAPTAPVFNATPASTASPITNLQVAHPASVPLPAGTPLEGGVNPNLLPSVRAGVSPSQIPGSPGYNGNTGVVGPKPYADLWQTSGSNPQAFVSAYIAQKGLKGAQANPAALTELASVLQSQGVNAVLDTRSDGLHKGLMIDGQFVKMLDGSDNWIWQPGSGVAANSDVSSSFSDPGTQQYAQILEQQLAILKAQQSQQLETNEQLKARQAAAMTSSDQLVDYLRKRADTLQQPGYTPSEQNILKTQATDPIEADRQAALQRALNNVGSRGFDPTSGIAQDLLRQVNQGFDQTRSTAQNDLAVRQITEQRSREQEAQQLMALIPQAQMAAANGDLSFLQQLDAAVSQLGAQAAVPAAQLYQLPMQSAQSALAALGQAPQPTDLTQQAIQLQQLATQRQSQQAQAYASYGTLIAPLLQLFGK